MEILVVLYVFRLSVTRFGSLNMIQSFEQDSTSTLMVYFDMGGSILDIAFRDI